MAHKLKRTRSNPPGGIDYNVLIVAGLGYLAYHYNAAGIKDFLGASGGKSGAGGGTSGGGGGGILAVDEGQIRKWASDIRLSYEVGRRFVAEHGRLPNTLDELVNWGNQNGYRLADTRWVI